MEIISRTRTFFTEHSDLIFAKIDQHLEKLQQNYTGFPILSNTVYIQSWKSTTKCTPLYTKKLEALNWISLLPSSNILLSIFLSTATEIIQLQFMRFKFSLNQWREFKNNAELIQALRDIATKTGTQCLLVGGHGGQAVFNALTRLTAKPQVMCTSTNCVKI